MASFSFDITDVRREDGRHGVAIHFVNDSPYRGRLAEGEEPLVTAAQAVSMVMIDTARKVCDEMGFVIEEVDSREGTGDTQGFTGLSEEAPQG